ncbi:unnamed protein product [Ceutorhynchus assimilis]|uniref:Condensin complex subunit 2 n=1 Tax=Ceutorhynchus assimilis TaxID=467358 RepID=A0A9N9MNP6_9CUCU|nr:unnamed protein product [Ceutorhynchus assimilis]
MLQASTPVPGPSHRRVSFLNTNGQHLSPLARPRNLDGLLDETNDDAERQERRKSAATRRSILAIPRAESPSLNDSVQALSDKDLQAQLQTVVKLHAENKINSKNAWHLRIIDIITQIASKNNPDALKVAGSSLEVASKVYGIRVDTLHSDGLKMAGNFARNFASNQQHDESNSDGPNGEDQANETQKKKKKEPKKKKFVLSGDKRTVNTDKKAFMESLPKLDSATFSARTDNTLSATSNLFTNKVRMDPAGYKFMFASKESAWAFNPGNDVSAKPETWTKEFPITVKSVKNYDTCAAFKDFRVDFWDPDQENNDVQKKNSLLDEVVLDDNGVPIPEMDGSFHDVFAEQGDNIMNDDDMGEEEVVNQLLHREVEHIVDFRPIEQSLATFSDKSAWTFNSMDETSAGRKIDQIWAGPSHWKLKCIRRTKLIYSGMDKNDEKLKEKNKPGRKRKKIEYFPIDFDNLKPPKDYSKSTKKPFKKRSLAVDEDKVTMPIYESSCEHLRDNIEYLLNIPTMKPIKKTNRDKSQNENCHYDVPDYNFKNPDDNDYCPQRPINDDMGEDLGDDIFENGADNGDNMSGFQAEENFTGANLIDAPQLIQQDYMHYATKAKKMDMKKLKQALWCTLTQSAEYNETDKVVPRNFAVVYKELYKRLPEKMAVELSPPIAIVALLHLCNERCLALKSIDVTDFIISKHGE